jgi:hypothetical protein
MVSYLFMVYLANDLSSSDYIVSDGRMINEQWTGKVLEGNGHGLFQRYYPDIHLEALRKTTKNLSQDSQYPEQDSNQAPPEYKLEMWEHLCNLLKWKHKTLDTVT